MKYPAAHRFLNRLLVASGLLLSLGANASPLRPEPVEPIRQPVAFRDRLLPAPVDGGFRQADYWVWCGTVAQGDDGKFHHYASRWPRGLPFSPHWLSNSEVVHSVADKPEGPYVFSDVALAPRGKDYEFWDGKMTHNPVVRRVNGKWVLFYTGTTYAGAMPTPKTPIGEESEMKLDAHHRERIGIAIADSPYGPWQRFPSPVIDVRPNSWEQYLTSNASPLVRPDGSILLYYKGVEKLRKHAIGVAEAKTVLGPYERLSDKPFEVGVGAEDPTMWYENGRYHALMLDHELRYTNKGIYYATSPDGLHWSVAPNPAAITADYAWADGQKRNIGATERPQILTQDGVATHVFIATGRPSKPEVGTWNQVIPLRPESAVPDRLAWWRDARFGLFIHWGLYSTPAGIWKGLPLKHDSYANPYCEHLQWLARIPLAEYRALATQFNPVSFDAQKIVAAAKAAGMRYVVFTAKHHDGFAMYRSEISHYNVVETTPWKRDPLRELAQACRQEGLALGIYYSLGRDWENPRAANASKANTWDFPPAPPEDFQRYLDEKVRPQLTELLTNYGDIGIVWFDTPEQITPKQSIALELLVRRLQPKAVINTRLGNQVGDYSEMDDNEIPARASGRDFEVPATMAESWGYSLLDTAPYWRSDTRLLRHLVDIASKGGNYLLNIGPDGSGAIPAPAAERLAAIAKWMKTYGEAIHGSRASTLRAPEWGRFTQRGSVLYAHVFEWPEAGLPLLLPVNSGFIAKIELLSPSGPQPLEFTASAGASVLVKLPPKAPDGAVSVIRVNLR